MNLNRPAAAVVFFLLQENQRLDCETDIYIILFINNQIKNERDRNDLNYDDYCRYSRKIITLLLRETTDWYTLVTSKKITRN